MVESLGATPAQIVVELAQYRDANGVNWAAGTTGSAIDLDIDGRPASTRRCSTGGAGRLVGADARVVA